MRMGKGVLGGGGGGGGTGASGAVCREAFPRSYLDL